MNIEKKLKFSFIDLMLFIAVVVFVAIVVSPDNENKPTNNRPISLIEKNYINNNFIEEQESLEDRADESITKEEVFAQQIVATKDSEQQADEYFKVVAVIDGDTFDIDINGEIERIRVIGMDTPETKDPRKPVQCFGEDASNKTKELLLNQKVKLVFDSTQDTRDKYNRLLGYIYREDGLFFNKWMIQNGYAYEYTYVIPYQFQQEFKQVEQYARQNELGLWSPDTCSGSTEIPTGDVAEIETTGNIWYTSSHWRAEFYYCDTDSGWEGLSPSYLKSFSSAEELLAIYDRTLHTPCE